MSIVNLIGSIVSPDYATVYLVDSEILQEASRREGARFEGMVGRITAADPTLGNKDYIDPSSFQVGDDGRIFVTINFRKFFTSDGNVREISVTKEVWTKNTLADSSQLHHLVVRSYYDVSRRSRVKYFVKIFASLIVGSIPILIIGLMSHYHEGQYTLGTIGGKMLRGMLMLFWLFYGLFLGLVLEIGNHKYRASITLIQWICMGCGLVLIIAGFRLVGGMLEEYGSCVKLY